MLQRLDVRFRFRRVQIEKEPVDHLKASESYHCSGGCTQEICSASTVEAGHTLSMINLSNAVYYTPVSGLRVCSLVLQPRTNNLMRVRQG
uniref:Uncharacterized protein n=1 Tax=Arundo donax TaxID=35708 RepID=A0A0A8XMX6_ARUDO